MIARRGGGEAQNIETQAVPAKIGGGNTARVALGRFSNLYDVNTTITSTPPSPLWYIIMFLMYE
jgi:hypothetical protein